MGSKHKTSINANPVFGSEHRRSDIEKPASRIEYRVSSIENPRSNIQHRVSSIENQVSRVQSPLTNASGFTLMEILLAFLILGIVLTTIITSFNAVFSTTDTLKNSSQYYDMAKNCLNRMTLDLGALYIAQRPLYKTPKFDDPPDPYRVVGSISEFDGTSFASVRFASIAHIPLNKSKKRGVAEIVYYVQGKDDGQPVLRRGDHLYPYPPFEENSGDPLLCSHVKSLAFKYYDSEGSEFEEWNSDSDEYGYATPAAIGIQLEVGDESVSYNFETTVRFAVNREKIEP